MSAKRPTSVLHVRAAVLSVWGSSHLARGIENQDAACLIAHGLDAADRAAAHLTPRAFLSGTSWQGAATSITAAVVDRATRRCGGAATERAVQDMFRAFTARELEVHARAIRVCNTRMRQDQALASFAEATLWPQGSEVLLDLAYAGDVTSEWFRLGSAGRAENLSLLYTPHVDTVRTHCLTRGLGMLDDADDLPRCRFSIQPGDGLLMVSDGVRPLLPGLLSLDLRPDGFNDTVRKAQAQLAAEAPDDDATFCVIIVDGIGETPAFEPTCHLARLPSNHVRSGPRKLATRTS